jgi:tRNA G10  N-methylase Trm11
MKRFLFILGRNWRLALSELEIYLQKGPFKGKIMDYSTTAAVVHFENDKTVNEMGDLMARLGTIQKIGVMLDFLNTETLQQAFPVDIEENRAQIYNGRTYLDNTLKDLVFEVFKEIENQKLFVANSIYPIEFSDEYYQMLIKHFLHYVNKFFNTYLKEKGAKEALYFQYPQEQIDSGMLNPIFPHHYIKYELYLPNRAEILYCQMEEGMYIGKTLTVVDANLQKAVDEMRPYKDFRQTIPPKFGKYLLSLLGAVDPSNFKVLDPFCGTGTILMFGYLMGFQMYGSDNDEKQIDGSRKNLQFVAQHVGEKLKPQFLSERINFVEIQHLASFYPESFFNGIASEPVLLPFYREKPNAGDVRIDVDETVRPLYKQFLEQSFKVLRPGGRLALVSPVILTQEHKHVHIPLPYLAKEVGFEFIQLISPNRLPPRTRESLMVQLEKENTLFDAGSERIYREFFLFEKPKSRAKKSIPKK